jgi:hypothetical protein
VWKLIIHGDVRGQLFSAINLKYQVVLLETNGRRLKMGSVGRDVKAWILVTLCSLLVWLIYWVPSSIDRFFGFNGISWDAILQRGRWMLMLMEVSASVGILLRCIGVSLGIFAVFVLIRNTSKKFFDVKKWVAFALIMESCYFLLLLPDACHVFFVRTSPSGT